MKIIYLHQYFNTPDMSGGTRSYEMARRWVAVGHQVHIITSWRNSTDKTGWFQTEVDGVNVHWLPVPYSNQMSYGRRIQAFFKFALAAGRRARELSGDVIFATSTPLTIAIPGVYASKGPQVPMVFEVRDLWPEVPIAMGALNNPVSRRLARKLEQYAYRNSMHIVALSPDMRDGVVAAGVSPKRVSVIPNSADLELFRGNEAEGLKFRDGLNLSREIALVLYAGTFGAVNGVSYLAHMAHAAKELMLPLHFLAVGDGAERTHVEILAKELGVLGAYMTLLPPVAKREVPAILAAADISCSLVVDNKALWANSANKFFDSLASGTPIAINYGGWQAGLLSKTGAGLVLPADDPQRGAAMLAELVADPDRLQQMGRAARALAEREFDRDKLAAQLEQVLVEAVRTNNKSGG